MPTLTGVATWFCCGPDGYPGTECEEEGRGACGTCDNARWQCAWQNLNDFPECYCDCPTPVSCGDCVLVYYPCNDVAIDVTVADHGPGACRGTAQDCRRYSGRITDLTPAAFDALAELSQGMISVVVGTCDDGTCDCWT